MGCCNCYFGHGRVTCRWLFGLGAIVCCIAIVCITFFHLQDVDMPEDWWRQVKDLNADETWDQTTVQCFLGTYDQSGDLCKYAYALCGISFLSVITLITLAYVATATCCNNCCFYVAPWLEVGLTVGNAVLWGIASIVLADSARKSNKENSPEKGWRNTVVVMTWGVAILFIVQSFLSLSEMFYAVCGCCGGREDAERRRTKRAELRMKQEELRQTTMNHKAALNTHNSTGTDLESQQSAKTGFMGKFSFGKKNSLNNGTQMTAPSHAGMGSRI